MKKLIRFRGIILFLAFIVMTIVASCENDDLMEEAPDKQDNAQVEEVEPQQQEDDPQSEINPDQLTGSLIFDNMKLVNGTPSTAKITSKGTIDLKIDSDTIFWTPGIIKRIKIKKPLGVSLSHGVWVYVPGADSYIETSLRDDEESDEVSILYFDFDPTGWELPITFPIEITPLDENGTPMDTFEEPVEIEERHDGNGSCNIDPMSDLQGYYWEWVFYKSDNPYFFTGSWYPHTQESSTNGCCIDGESDHDAICTGANNRVLDYEISFMRPLLYMIFTGDKVNVYGQLYSRNLDPSKSNYCTNSAGYSESNLMVFKFGDYSINGDCSISFDNFEYDGNPSFLVDPTLYIGGGSQIKYTIISDHYMEQTITGSGGDGGGSGEFIASVFERRRNIEVDGGTWYD